jgi:hypothetical protein
MLRALGRSRRATRRRVARPLTQPPERLEGRAVPALTSLSLTVSPELLRPINPRLQPHALTLQHQIPTTLAGEVTFTKELPVVSYQVIDSLGIYQPSGAITPQMVAPGRAIYNARIGLSDLRQGGAARQYEVIVTASDSDGIARQVAAFVNVPPHGFFVASHRRAFTLSRYV